MFRLQAVTGGTGQPFNTPLSELFFPTTVDAEAAGVASTPGHTVLAPRGSKRCRNDHRPYVISLAQSSSFQKLAEPLGIEADLIASLESSISSFPEPCSAPTLVPTMITLTAQGVEAEQAEIHDIYFAYSHAIISAQPNLEQETMEDAGADEALCLVLPCNPYPLAGVANALPAAESTRWSSTVCTVGSCRIGGWCGGGKSPQEMLDDMKRRFASGSFRRMVAPATEWSPRRLAEELEPLLRESLSVETPFAESSILLVPHSGQIRSKKIAFGPTINLLIPLQKSVVDELHSGTPGHGAPPPGKGEAAADAYSPP